jgi:hypothetical protein
VEFRVLALAIKVAAALFPWEEDLYREFLLLLEVAPISLDKPSWVFRHSIGGMFYVKANYDFLSSLLASPSFLASHTYGVVHKVWKSWGPQKW